MIRQIQQNQTLLMFTSIWLPLLSNAWRITLPHVLEVNLRVVGKENEASKKLWMTFTKYSLLILHLLFFVWINGFHAIVLEKKSNQSTLNLGNQSWISIRRTDAEAQTPILWPPDVKSQLIRKDPDAGKDRRQEEKGTTEDEMVGLHHWLNGR